MTEIRIAKNRAKEFLAERLTKNILQADEKVLFNIIRTDGIRGMNVLSDEELFRSLTEAIPEFELLNLAECTRDMIIARLDDEYTDQAEEIMIDIQRIVQTRF